MSGRYEAIPDSFPAFMLPGMVLRQVEERDAPNWFARNSDPEVVFAMGGDVMADVSEAHAAIGSVLERFREKTMIRWAIVPNGCMEAVGTTGFNAFDEHDLRAELGYGLAKEWWGRGLMTAANRAVISFAFEELGLNRVEATVLIDNQRSVSVLEKLGFTREGLLREQHVVDGVPRDFWMFSVLRREWPKAPG